MKRIGFILSLIFAVMIVGSTSACSDSTGPGDIQYDVVLPTIPGYYGSTIGQETEVIIYFDAPASWPARIDPSKTEDANFKVIGKPRLEKQPFQNSFGGRINYQYTIPYKTLTSRMTCIDLIPFGSPNGSTQLCLQGSTGAYYGEKGNLLFPF